MINNEAPPPPQSPWKKPRVSMLKTKSFKRKSDIFNLTNNDSFNSSKVQAETSIAEEDFGQKSKERKTILNRFSVKNTSSFLFSRDNSFNNSNLNDDENNSVNEVSYLFILLIHENIYYRNLRKPLNQKTNI